MSNDRWDPDPADVARRKKQLLEEAGGQKSGDGPNSMVGLGVQFVVTILVCLFAGQWLDRKLGTTPWLVLAGVLLGAALGMWMMVRAAREQDLLATKARRAKDASGAVGTGDERGQR